MAASRKQGVIGLLGPGDFLGEGGLAGQSSHTSSATAILPSAIIAVGTHDMRHLLRADPAMSDRFIAHMLARNIRSESALVDHLFNACEQRLARTLLQLAASGTLGPPDHVMLHITQETLGAMVGTTRSRVNLILNRFRKRGFVEYAGPRHLKINRALLAMIVDD